MTSRGRSSLRTEHIVAVLEQIYAGGDASARRWSEALVPKLSPLFERAGTVGLTIVRFDPPELVSLAFDAPLIAPEAAVQLFNRAIFADRSLLERQFRPPRPVVLRSELGGLPDGVQGVFDVIGIRDALGMASEPEPGLGLAAYVLLDDSQPPSASERALLTRVALHLDAGARLRFRPDAVVGYVTPEGRVELGGGEGDVRARVLGATAQGIDRARTRRYRSDGEGALEVWPALVSGRLSLAERVDTDGKRLYDLYENAPKHEALRALTAREGTVLHECARGLSNKEVAYALGISQAAVSQSLASAAHKLGLTSVRSTVRLVSGLRGAGSTVASIEKLSASERAVLALVAEGKSNAQIARARGSAERTVANQVAAILRKTGARSRRELSLAGGGSS